MKKKQEFFVRFITFNGGEITLFGAKSLFNAHSMARKYVKQSHEYFPKVEIVDLQNNIVESLSCRQL